MTPLQVLRTPGLALVDIRPVAERYGSVGFVPGSLSIPAVDSPEQTRRMICEAAGDRTPVLVCLSGRRAQHHASCDATQGGELAYLEGGVLAWAASGLPVSGVNLQPSDDAPELADFPRHMAACFVGQLVEVSLDRAESIDPMELLGRCFARAGVSFTEPTPSGLLRVLDEAAIASIELGTPLERVAANLDHMLARLPAPTRALVP